MRDLQGCCGWHARVLTGLLARRASEVSTSRPPPLSLLPSKTSDQLVRASRRRRGSLALRPHPPLATPQAATAKAEGGTRGAEVADAGRSPLDTGEQARESIWAVADSVTEDPPDQEFCSGGIARDPAYQLSPRRGRLGTVRRRFAPKLATEHPAKFLAGHLGTFVGQNRHGVVEAGFMRLHASGACAWRWRYCGVMNSM